MATSNTSVRRDDSSGNQIKTVTSVVLDSSYPTGGEPLTAADLGLNVVQDAICQVKVAGTGSVTAAFYDIASAKLLAYTASAQVANGTDLSAITVQVTAWGYR